jgi:predicted nucleic acid-binding protein
MPVLGLANVPSGADVYIDANILVYAMLNQSPECEAFLKRCATDVYGYSDVRVLHDCLHQLMLADAEFTSGNPQMRKPKALKQNPALISRLTHWHGLAKLVMQLPIEWVDLVRADIARVPMETSASGLLCGDALITVLMQTYGISEIASRDADFSHAGLTVYVPSDI